MVLVGFRSLVKVESTYWVLVKLLYLQNELMDVHQSDISKMLLPSTSNFSFMFIKSHHFTWVYCYIVTYVDSHLHTCTYICRIIHSNTTIKTQEGRHRKKRCKTDFFKNIFLPLTLLQGFERVVQGLHKRGCWRPNINFIFWPPLLMTVTLCLSCSLNCSTRGL